MENAGIVAFAFGAPATIDSNRRIAQIASRKARELDISVYTQLDMRINPGIRVTRICEKAGQQPSTLRIAQGAVRWARRYEFNELLIVAAKPHLWRVLRDMKQAVREAGGGIDIHVCKEAEQYPEDLWFCAESTHRRTQSRKIWEGRECFLKLMPFFLYKRLAS